MKRYGLSGALIVLKILRGKLVHRVRHVRGLDQHAQFTQT